MACAAKNQPMDVVDYVDLDKYMGDWYVIAATPTFIDKTAFNGVENYKMNADGTIAITYTFNKGAPDGPKKTYTPKGFVTEHPSNAIWGVQFLWPFKADYRIIYLNDDKTQTIVGRKARDYVWIMARKPKLTQSEYNKLVNYALEAGYTREQIKKMPQPSNIDPSNNQKTKSGSHQ